MSTRYFKFANIGILLFLLQQLDNPKHRFSLIIGLLFNYIPLCPTNKTVVYQYFFVVL